MKKNILSILALVLALVSLGISAMSLGAAGRTEEANARAIQSLEQENEMLRGQLEQLASQLDRLQTVASLESWTLDVRPWADNSGADVVFTAVPTEYVEGVSATLLVTLRGENAVSIPCTWDGSAFTATAGLTPQDGYGYYCILVSPGGTQQLSLTTPEAPTLDIPVYLASSLSSYCNLAVSDWRTEAGALILTQAYAQAQLPRITAAGAVALEKAELVLTHNGGDLIRMPIVLSESEVMGSWDALLADVRLQIPELAEGDVLELHLAVKLTDGTLLTAYGASWYPEGDGLSSMVG